jgi:hypothetical protein
MSTGYLSFDQCSGLPLCIWCHSCTKRVETCQSALCPLQRYWDCERQSDRKRETSKQSSRRCGSANSNIRLVHKIVPGFIRILRLSLPSFSVFHVFASKSSLLSNVLNCHNRSKAGVAGWKHIFKSHKAVLLEHNTDWPYSLLCHMSSIGCRKYLLGKN